MTTTVTPRTTTTTQIMLMSMSMSKGTSRGNWGRVWRYEGPRGVIWRIRYRDASGRRVLETLGSEPEWSRTRAEKELRRRLVDVERDGYRKPEKITFATFAERWLEEYLPSRNLKPSLTGPWSRQSALSERAPERDAAIVVPAHAHPIACLFGDFWIV